MESKTTDSSLYGFGSIAISNTGICCILLFVFSAIRSFDRNIYVPKTYMVSTEKQFLAPQKGFFSWIIPVWYASEETVLRVGGLDALMFLKFLRAAMLLFPCFTVVSFIVLVPINVIDRGNGKERPTFKTAGMELLTMNGTDENNYQWAHVSCMILFVSSVVFLLYKSVMEYAELRQDCILRPEHSATIKARTLLVASIPKHLNNKDSLYKLFNIFPGGVKHVFINRNVGALSALTRQRDVMHYKIEQLLARWIALNVKARLKQNNNKTFQPPSRIVHRTGLFGLYGKKVDSIDFYFSHILSINRAISDIRANRDNLEVQESAFILFNTQIGAQIAAQSLISNHVLHFNPRYVESAPEDIIWSNLNFSAVQFMFRKKIGLAIAIAMALLWFFPSGLIATISQFEKLEEVYPIFKKILPQSPSTRGYLQGILPPILTNILTALVPIIFTILSTLEGHRRTGDVQLSVMTKYFGFLVSTVLLAPTLGSTIPSLIAQFESIQKDSSYIFRVFAKKLPPASKFFINFVLLKALITSCQELLQIVNLIKRRLLVWLFVSSPRKHLQVIEMQSICWGVIWPDHTLVFSIGLLYSVLAPVSNFVMSIYFLMFYLVYKHQILFVYHTEKNQAQGMFFMKAVSQIYIGIYIFLGTFAGLMLLQAPKGIPKFMVTIVVFLVTAFTHGFLLNKYTTVVKFIPIQKALESYYDPSPNESCNDSCVQVHDTCESIPLKKMPEASDYINFNQTSLEINEPKLPLSPKESQLENYFAHPDLISSEPILWVPQDESGFSDWERTKIFQQASGSIRVSTHGATMDPNGRIKLTQFSYPEFDQSHTV